MDAIAIGKAALEFIEARFHNGDPDPEGWACRDHMGEEICDAPARAIVEDGRWCGMAACRNPKHIADALRMHNNSKQDPTAWDDYRFPRGEA